MHGRWHFRLVKADCTAEYLMANGQPLEHDGTDQEALALAVHLQNQHEGVGHVEAVSVGLPADITATPGRLLVRIEERSDRQGWNLNGDLMTGFWYRNLVHAVGYAASRTCGYVCEIRIINRHGKVTHIVLIDTTKGYDGRLYSAQGGRGSH